jgi:glycine/D-amino acid oxidase-like deaminating enzyme
MGRQTLHTDIAIIGGGIAGLWTLNQLRKLGYSAILFEQRALGSEQTIGSQGMIHGGLKYALAGNWGSRAETISAMPGIWRQCLRGEGKVDLRGTRVLSEDFFLWSSARLQSRLTAFLASKMLRGRVEKVTAQAYPKPLQSPDFHGQVYRLEDLVLDVPSLLETLASRQRDAIYRIDWQAASLQRDGNRAVLDFPDCTVVPQRLVLTAGAGNEALIATLGATAPAMQRRPLQQVLVKHQYQPDFYSHCMGTSSSPRLTVSSHRSHDNRPVWYLGGDLATSGAGEEPQQLIARAKGELEQLLPWIDFGQTEWRTIRLDRAEPLPVAPRQAASLQTTTQSDSAFVGRVKGVDNALAAWPTKLTLSPNLADAIEQHLVAEGIMPRHRPDLAALASLGTPPVATPYWDTLLP